MRFTELFKGTFKGMVQSVSRYPLTILFLLAVAGLNAQMIEETQVDYDRYIFTFLVGAMLSVVAQTIYERFFTNERARYLLMLATVLLTIGYYFIIGAQLAFDPSLSIKTSVALFALMIAFIWIPTINNDYILFHQSFLSTTKAFFTSVLFSGVLALGISAIFSATSTLLFNIDYRFLAHSLNIVGTMFAPIYFLSLTPHYYLSSMSEESVTVTNREDDKLAHQLDVPKFFEVLLSYIVIPIIVIYTLILVLYVFLNITGDFWTNNLLEPLLVSYAVIVIIVLILSYTMDNRFTLLFRKFFPKVLVPVVVFQTIASVLKINEMGITHGRYYVILFGVFATVTGLVFSFLPPKKHGYIALVLLVLATLSIVPPIDAFTVSKNNQLNLLEETLLENNMISDNTISPNANTPIADRVVITNVMSYIESMGYDKELDFLPDNYESYGDFNQTFGFNRIYTEDESSRSPVGGQYIYLEREEDFVFDIGEYDVMLRPILYHTIGQESQSEGTTSFEVNGEMYELERRLVGDYYSLIVKDATGNELISYLTEEIFVDVFGETLPTEYVEQSLDEEEATFEIANDNVRMKVLLISLERTTDYLSMEFYILIDIKE